MCRFFFIFTVTSKTTFMTVKRMLCLLFLLCVGEAWGQKWEVNSVRNDYVYVARFDRFVTDKDRTVADVTLRNTPGWRIQYTAGGQYLRDRESGKMYKLIGAEGIELNSWVYMDKSGEMKARLIFEPLDKEAKCLDFHGWNPPFQNTWGIWLSDPPMALPAWAEGTWMTTDGSNRWVCGFFPQIAVWENDFWEYGEVTKKGRNVWVELRQEGKDTTFCLREGKEGTLLFGVDGKRFDTLGKEFVSRSGSEVSTWSYDPEKYRNELYNKGTAVIRGIFEGYTPDLGFTTGIIESHNLLTDEDYTHLIDIQPDGRFELKMELEHPQHVTMKLNDAFIGTLFVEPGDTLMCRLMLTDVFNPQYIQSRTPIRMDGSRFMGRAAEYNTYRNLSQQIIGRGCSLIDKMADSCRINGLSDVFKACVDEQLQSIKDSMQVWMSQYAMSDRTKDLLYTDYIYTIYNFKLYYAAIVDNLQFISEMTPEGYVTKPNPDYIPLPDNYFDFLSMEWLDNPLFITSSESTSVLGCLDRFPLSLGNVESMIDNTSGGGALGPIYYVEKKMHENHKELTEEQLRGVDSIKQSFINAISSPNAVIDLGKDTVVSNLFWKYMEEYDNQRDSLYALGTEFYEKYFYSRAFEMVQSYGLDRCLVYDYLLFQDFVFDLAHRYAEASEQVVLEQMSKMLPYIKTPYVVKNVINRYADVLALRSMSDMFPASENQPRTPADEYFEELIAPYAGNVLYIDFWSTGCAPCKQGMIRAREYVESMKERKIKFLYITSEADSPLGAYQKFLDQFQIKGEHLRITKDQWNLLASKFDIQAIPHCVIVNKRGEVVDNNSGRFRTMSGCLDALNKLIEE